LCLASRGWVFCAERNLIATDTPMTAGSGKAANDAEATNANPAPAVDQALLFNRRGEAALLSHLHLQALADFDRALALRRDFAAAAHNRGRALRELGRLYEAIDWQTQALALQPAFAAALAHRAACRCDIGDSEAALHDYEAAIALDPSQAQWQVACAMLLGDLGRPHEARDAYRRAIAHGANAAEVEFLLAAADGSVPPPSSPASYVATLFDAYAPRFERHLTRRLKYRAPQLLADALLPLLSGGAHAMADLGCGTGLMGALLRAHASRLDGVDVSAKMLERARTRGIYDALHAGELTQFLAARPAAYDVLVAADVFVYIGSLQPAFVAARDALRPDGLLAFTVEALDDGDYVLQPTRRYAHSRRYIEHLADAHGLASRGMTRRTLRLNGDVEVQGYVAVFAARKRRG